MTEKKFDDILSDFCNKKELTEQQTKDFELFIQEVFMTVSEEMKSRKYDFVALKYVGTFFLKVWTVAKEMKKKEYQYNEHPEYSYELKIAKRRTGVEFNALKALYKRMTDSFIKRKIYILERREERKEKKLTQSYMTDMSIEFFENEKVIKEKKDESKGNIETGLGE